MVLVITFLLDSVVGFFTLLLLLRFLMQLMRVSFANPVGSFVVQTTNWLVTPLRRVIPSVMGLDLASLIPAWLLQCLLLWVVYYLRSSLIVIDDGMLVLLVLWRGLMGALRIAVWIYIGALFLQAVMSWINPYSPLTAPVSQLTRPLLRPIQRFLPPIANIDLSPLVAIVLLQAFLLLL